MLTLPLVGTCSCSSKMALGAWLSSSPEASSELSGSSRTGASENIGLWLQVRDVDAVGHELKNAGVDIIEVPTDKPWGLREMQIRDPDGMSIVIVEVPETRPGPASLSTSGGFFPPVPPFPGAVE